MKSIKKRFRQALFAFFKEEILDEVLPFRNYRDPQAFVQQVGDRDILELRSEFRLGRLDKQMNPELPIELLYEEKLTQAKRHLFDAAMRHVRIDEYAMTHNEVRPGERFVRMSLYVLGKNKI